MSGDLERLQKRLAGDGPAERQVLLLKLLHEFETAPNFGDQYVSDANSPSQRWIARIGALLARVGLQHKVDFQVSRRTLASYWSISREDLRQQLLAAAEEIKLELELDGHENIGRVYDSRHQYDFLRDFREILLGAENEVFVIDPYFDGEAFETYLGPLVGNCSIRVLCSKHSREVAGHASAYEAQYGVAPDIRKNSGLHDRLVIIDGSDCWVVGGSIKDVGRRPTYLVPLQPGISPTKIGIYENLWEQSTPL